MFFNPLNQKIDCPVLRYKSERTGPKVVLTCLNHGNEVIGLSTAVQVLNFLRANEATFCGELVIFSCLNYEGFLQNSRFFAGENLNGSTIPNLNRTWPGNGESYSGVFAQNMFQKILQEKPDLVLDLHSYAQNSLIHTIVDRPGGEMEQNLLKLCQNAQIPFYLEYEAETFAAQSLDKSLSNQLCLHKIPSLTVELGPLGSFTQTQEKLATQAVLNLLQASGNLILPVENLYEKQKTEIEMQKIYYREALYNDSLFSGFYRPLVQIGKFLKKGQEVAQIINLYGEIVHTVKMPQSGFLLVLEDGAVVYPQRQIGVIMVEKV